MDHHIGCCQKFFGLCAGLQAECQTFFLDLGLIVFHFLQEHRVFVELKDVAGCDGVTGNHFLQRLATALKGERNVEGQPV